MNGTARLLVVIACLAPGRGRPALAPTGGHRGGAAAWIALGLNVAPPLIYAIVGFLWLAFSSGSD